MNNHLLLLVIIASYTTFLPFSTSFTLIQLRRQQNRVRSNHYDVVLSMTSNNSNNNNKEKKVSDELYFPNSQKVTSSSSSNTNNHISILKKQLGGQTNPGDAAIEVPSCTMCQHGYPQVFGMNPFVDPASATTGGSNNNDGGVRKKKSQRLNSSLLKLTCPLLVKAIDEMEDDGYIESHFNPQLQMIDTTDDNNNDDEVGMIKMKNQRVEQLRKALKESHELHAQVRNKIVYSDVSGNHNIQLLNSKLGRQQQERVTSTNNDNNNNYINITEIFLNSGIAGIANNTKQMNTDVKCLHAWLGDYLFFGNTTDSNNKKKNHWIGTQIEQILLNEYDISLNGSSNCKCMCDPSFEALDQVQLKDSLAVAAPKPRNKQRKRTRKEIARRKRKRHQEQLLEL